VKCPNVDLYKDVYQNYVVVRYAADKLLIQVVSEQYVIYLHQKRYVQLFWLYLAIYISTFIILFECFNVALNVLN